MVRIGNPHTVIFTALLTHHTAINLVTQTGEWAGQQGNSRVRRGESAHTVILTALITHHPTINLVAELRVHKGQGGQEHGNSRVRREVRTGSLTCKVIRTALATAQTTD